MSHSPTKKIWAGALSALLALFAALVVATPALAEVTATSATITYEDGSWNVQNLGTVDTDYTLDGDVLTLLDDYTVATAPIIVSGQGSLTIASTKEVTVSATGGISTLDPKALLTVNGGAQVTLSGSVVLSDTGGSADLENAAVVGIHGAGANKPSALTVTGNAKITSTNNVCISGNNTYPECNVTISGNAEVTAPATAAAIYAPAQGTVTVSGGSITGGAGIVANGDTSVNVSGGSITSNAEDATDLSGIGQTGNSFPPAAVSLVAEGGYGSSNASSAPSANITGGVLSNSNPDNTNTVVNYAESEGAGQDTTTVEPSEVKDVTVTAGTFKPSENVNGYFDDSLTYATTSSNGYTTYGSGTNRDNAINSVQSAAAQATDILSDENYSVGNIQIADPSTGEPTGPVLVPEPESGSDDTSGATPDSPAIAAVGFNAEGSDALDAILKAVNLESWNDVWGSTPANASNVAWIVLNGEANQKYGAQVTYAGANSTNPAVFSTLDPSSNDTDLSSISTNYQGYAVVWFSFGGGASITNQASAPAQPVCTTYTVKAWPANNYTKVEAATNNTLAINGVSYWNGKSAVAIRNAYGQVDSSVELSLGQNINWGDDKALSAWTYNGQSYVPGDAFTLPAPTGQPIKMMAQLGTAVTLDPDAVYGNQQGVFVNSEGEPIDALEGAAFMKIGATSSDTLPALPNLAYDGTITTINDDIYGYAFVGWYSFSTADGYTLYEAGDALPEDETLELSPLFCPVDVAWTPAISVNQIVGETATYDLAVTLDTDALAEAVDDEALETSQAATDFFATMAAKDLTEPLAEDSADTNTDLENLVLGSTNNYTVKGTTVVANTDGTSFTVSIPTSAIANSTAASNFTLTAYVPYAGLDVPAVAPTAVTTNPTNVLKVNVHGALSVTISPSSAAGTVTQTYENGGYVLTAVPADGWHFDHWISPLGTTITANPANVGNGAVNFGTYTAVFAPGSVTPAPTGQVAVTVMYNPYNGDHLFTTQASEVSGLTAQGWLNYGIAWNAPDSGTPVYRIYNPYSHDHYWATSKAEMDGLVALGWQWDNNAQPVFYSAGADGVPVYQLFNPYVEVGTHYWTTNYNEYNQLIGLHWDGNNISWYAASLAS